jgi:hypothetical protein
MGFDEADPYDTASWWHVHLSCQKCGTIQDYDSNSTVVEGSNDYWHEYGQHAKFAGWTVIEHSPKAEWTILCPDCSSTTTA